MTGGVEEHTERRTRLMLVLGRAQLMHRCLGDVEVVDHDIEVHLLRDALAGPLWRREAVDLLEAQRVAVLGTDGPRVVVVLLDPPVEQGAVELGQALRVGAVKDDAWEACDSHDRTISAVPDGELPDCQLQSMPSGAIGSRRDTERPGCIPHWGI